VRFMFDPFHATFVDVQLTELVQDTVQGKCTPEWAFPWLQIWRCVVTMGHLRHGRAWPAESKPHR